MPSTPRFTLRQDADFVYVDIRVPYVRVSGAEFRLTDGGTQFTFYCKPYLLRLTFPSPLVDDDRAKAVHDVTQDNGTITVHLPKACAGEHFRDLDLLTTLLQPRRTGPRAARPAAASAAASASAAADASPADRLRSLLEEQCRVGAGVPGSAAAQRRSPRTGGGTGGRPLIEVVSSTTTNDTGGDGDGGGGGDGGGDDDHAPSVAVVGSAGAAAVRAVPTAAKPEPKPAKAPCRLLSAAAAHSDARPHCAPGRPLVEVISSTPPADDNGGDGGDDGGNSVGGSGGDCGSSNSAAAKATASAKAPGLPSLGSQLSALNLGGGGSGRRVAVAAADAEAPPRPPPTVSVRVSPPGYGFNDQYHDFFAPLADDFPELVELPAPDSTPVSERTAMREAREKADFDGDRYASDYLYAGEEYVFTGAMELDAPWFQALRRKKKLLATLAEERKRAQRRQKAPPPAGPSRRPAFQFNPASATKAKADGEGTREEEGKEEGGTKKKDQATAFVFSGSSFCSGSDGGNDATGSDASVALGAANADAGKGAVFVFTSPTSKAGGAGAAVGGGGGGGGGGGDNNKKAPPAPTPAANDRGGIAAPPQSATEIALLDEAFVDPFSDEENEALMQLPNKEFLLPPFTKTPEARAEEHRVLCGLFGVLFAYAYDVRTTAGEHNVESPYTIRILAPVLSWLDIPGRGPLATARACARRAFTYPFVRHRDLCARALGDALCLLGLGRRAILRALLRIRHIFSRSDAHYLLGRIFFDDYCVWIQKVDAATLTKFATEAGGALASTGVCVIEDNDDGEGKRWRRRRRDDTEEGRAAQAWGRLTGFPLVQLEDIAREHRREEEGAAKT